MPLIDTLALKTGLFNGGMPEAQASAIVEALANADTGQLATKADVADLNGRIDTLHAEMNGRFDALHSDVNGRFDDLKCKLKLLLAFFTPLLVAVLALLWRAFFR